MSSTPSVAATRRTIRRIYAVILTIGSAYLLFILITGWGIPCLYHLTTGWLCPGCGISRMFLSLARGDIAAAFAYNPVMFCLLPLWNLEALLCYWGRFPLFRRPAWLYSLLTITVTVLLVFTWVRNLP